MARVFWDTNLFIYLFEAHPEWCDRVVHIRERMLVRKDTLVTSWMTAGEIATRPLALGDDLLIRRYRALFDGPAVEMIPFDGAAADHYAQIRACQRVRPADAIQLACAAAARCDLFLTNDVRLHQVQVDGIAFITGVERAPL